MLIFSSDLVIYQRRLTFITTHVLLYAARI